ncbi:iron ABC transporter permease [bacterium]|nr:iron ABC transporter permease [bacterium]
MKLGKQIFYYLLFIALILFALFFKWEQDNNILFNIRIPEVLTALLVGFALGFSGSISQIIFKNPLADPYILGVSSGSTFGISLAFITGAYYILGINSVFLFSLLMGIISIIIIFSIYRLFNKNSITLLLLTGVVYGFLMSSLTTLIMSNISGDKIYSLFEWLFGTVYFYNMKILIIFFIVIVIALIFSYGKGNILNKMYFSDKKAISLGVNVKKEQFLFFLIVAILVSISVSISGIIGFLGLMSPHITRRMVGNESRKLTFYSGLNGSLMLLFAYLLTKNITVFYVPVGIITSFFGSIYFIFLLVRKGGFDI